MIENVILNDNRVYEEIAAQMIRQGLYAAGHYTKNEDKKEKIVRIAIDYLMRVNTPINPTLEKENMSHE